MRKFALTAAPLVLLAACGETTPADEVEPQPMPTDTVAVSVDLPEIPANSLTTIDYPGTYMRAEAAGPTRLTLNEDMTYVLSRGDGTTVSGTYTALEDGSRIRLEDFDGKPAFFSIGTGAIYLLPDESTPYSEITVEGEYTRMADTPAAPAPNRAAPTPAEPAEADEAE